MSDARYKNGKIYKIVNNENDKVYYGSTCVPLYKRMYQHRKIHDCMSKNIGVDLKQCQIILVEEIKCENKQQLLMRERWYVENNECLNKNRPIITKEEKKTFAKKYFQDNKEKIKEVQKKHYEKNKTELIKKSNDYYKNNKGKQLKYGKEYREKNHDKQLNAMKEWREKNNVKITCDCGSICAKRNIKEHLRTKKHQDYLNTISS